MASREVDNGQEGGDNGGLGTRCKREAEYPQVPHLEDILVTDKLTGRSTESLNGLNAGSLGECDAPSSRKVCEIDNLADAGRIDGEVYSRRQGC